MDFELPDGTPLPLAEGATGADAAAAIGPGLARAALAVKVDGETRDLSRPLLDPAFAAPADGRAPKLEILTERSGDEALALIRHDTAHVLAAAMLELYPGVRISIGPAIENGFYYDFEFPARVQRSSTRSDLAEDRGGDEEATSPPTSTSRASRGDRSDEALDIFRAQGIKPSRSS